MKKLLSKWLVKLGLWLDPASKYLLSVDTQRIGIGYHISKKDVKDYRKIHTEYPSHRAALAQLVKDAKWRVAVSIAKGLLEKNLIDFEVDKTPYVADVGGSVCLYVKGE